MMVVRQIIDRLEKGAVMRRVWKSAQMFTVCSSMHTSTDTEAIKHTTLIPKYEMMLR